MTWNEAAIVIFGTIFLCGLAEAEKWRLERHRKERKDENFRANR